MKIAAKVIFLFFNFSLNSFFFFKLSFIFLRTGYVIIKKKEKKRNVCCLFNVILQLSSVLNNVFCQNTH